MDTLLAGKVLQLVEVNDDKEYDPIYKMKRCLLVLSLLSPSDYVSSPTVENRTTFLGVRPEDAESSSDAVTTGLDGAVFLLNGSSLDILDCSLAENNDAEALRLERGVDGTLDGKLESEASDAEGVRGMGEVSLRVTRVVPDVELGFLRDERGGGGGNISEGAVSLRRCT